MAEASPISKASLPTFMHMWPNPQTDSDTTWNHIYAAEANYYTHLRTIDKETEETRSQASSLAFSSVRPVLLSSQENVYLLLFTGISRAPALSMALQLCRLMAFRVAGLTYILKV